MTTKLSLYQTLFICRIYAVISITLSVLMVVFEPLSTLGRAAILVGDSLIYVILALILCFVAISDIIINDILPKNIELSLVYDNRHVIYMLLAVLSVSLSVVVISTYGSSFLLCRLWLDGSLATVVAFLDIKERHRKYFGKQIHFRAG